MSNQTKLPQDSHKAKSGATPPITMRHNGYAIESATLYPDIRRPPLRFTCGSINFPWVQKVPSILPLSKYKTR